MILSRKSPETGGIFALIVGTVVRDAKYYEDHGGKATFSLRYASVPSKTEGRKKDGLFFNCVARRELAEIAAALEKGDTVLAAGTVSSRTFTSKKTNQEETWPELECEMLIPQPVLQGEGPEGLDAPSGDQEDAYGEEETESYEDSELNI